MPTFSSANVTDPFLSQNELLAPMLAHLAAQEKLGNLDINRRELALRQNEAARTATFGEGLLKELKTIPPDGVTGTTGATGGGAAMGGGGSVNVPAEYLPYYQEASARTGIPVEVLIAQHKQESGFNPNATGAAGEIGIGQILPSTARSPGFGMQGIDPATLRDPRTNINFSADYLKARGGPRTDFSNPATVAAALKNYNGGGDPNYVANVLRYAPAAPPVVAAAPPPPFNPNAGPRVGLTPPAVTTGQADPANMAAVKQASMALLAMPEAEAAVAYGPVVRSLQAQGFAMNAPPTYPGHAALQAIVGEGDPAAPTVEPSRVALRTGGTDTAGPAAGQTTLPPVEQPNRMYQTGLPGVEIRGPGNALAPPPVAMQTAATPPPVAQAPATRPPVVAPPPAPSRTIQREPLIQSGVFAGVTRTQARTIAEGAAAGMKPAQVMQDIATARHQNDVIRQNDATQAALEAQQNFERQRQYQQDLRQRDQDMATTAEKAETARRNAAADAIAAAKEARATAKDEAEQKARIKGDAIAAQHENTLLEGTDSGETNTSKYASAYSGLAAGRYNADGSFVKPNMNAYAKPTFIPPGATEVPDYGKQDTPGPLPPPAIMTGMQANVSGMRNIDAVLRDLKAHPDSVGVTAYQPEWLLQRTDPEGIALRAGIADILSQTFHDRSGASVTLSESPRLKPFVPDAKDSAVALRTKLERIRSIYRDVLEDNYSVYGPEGTGRMLPVVERALKQTPKSSDKTDNPASKPPPPGFKVIQ